MNLLTFMVLLLVLVAYIAVGGVVFHILEENQEQETRQLADKFVIDFLANNTCVSPEELRELLLTTLDAYRSGQLTVNNTSTASDNWDYYSAIFFATTVVTTIGYGKISPVTLGGRIFCVPYALIGIPLFLVVAAYIGDRFYRIIKRARKCCFKSDFQQKVSTGAKICGNIFYILFGIGFFIIVPGVIFKYLEGWTFLEGFYYSFISLTTIGFGDYVAGTNEETSYAGYRGIYRLCTAGWLLLGLSWMAGLISSIQDGFSKNIDEREQEASRSRQLSRSSAKANNVIDRNTNPGDLMRVYSVESNRPVNGNGVIHSQESNMEAGEDQLTKL